MTPATVNRGPRGSAGACKTGRRETKMHKNRVGTRLYSRGPSIGPVEGMAA